MPSRDTMNVCLYMSYAAVGVALAGNLLLLLGYPAVGVALYGWAVGACSASGIIAVLAVGLV